ncbi:similar to amp-dependent synthetase and ligase [Botrytis cinerea T4]|uniref:medium-chain acyl-CoA ligase n=1 Tax=Botryotinia fuckeliana (strain T4) TaxID=999810 RepID=G2Y556_BOTF4|nr:similar to amp-dependent synthetase and ligase [Botrytis cinerea T4]
MTQLHSELKPPQFNFVREVVDQWSQRRGDSPALVLVTQKRRKDVSYRELSERSIQVASAFYELGIRPGDTIVISAARCRDWYEILCACLRSGIIICPVASGLSGLDLEHRIQKVHAKAFIGDLVQVEKVLPIKPRLATLQHMIQIGYDDRITDAIDYSVLVATALSSKIAGEHWCQLSPGSLFWSLSEVGWVKGSWAVFAAWNHGAALLVDETPSQMFDPIHTLRIMHEYPVTNFCATPTAYRQLVTPQSREFAASHPPQMIRICISAGETIESTVIKAWGEMTRGATILNGYGLTETVFLCTETIESQRPGSMGRPLPGIPLEILSDDAEPVVIGEEGAIGVCVSDCKDSIYDVFNGYMNEEGVVTRPIVRSAAGKEYYLTGDRAYQDEEGYFWFKARKDDIINCSGYRIGPSEVEAVLQSHPGVLESAVVGIPDEERGSIIKAYVVLNQEYETKAPRKLQVELRQHCLNNSAPYKCPRVIEFIRGAKLPRTVTGKVQRHELRAWEQKSNQ